MGKEDALKIATEYLVYLKSKKNNIVKAFCLVRMQQVILTTAATLILPLFLKILKIKISKHRYSY